MFIIGLKNIDLESQWVRNACVIAALDDNNNNGWEPDNYSDSESNGNSDEIEEENLLLYRYR